MISPEYQTLEGLIEIADGILATEANGTPYGNRHDLAVIISVLGKEIIALQKEIESQVMVNRELGETLAWFNQDYDEFKLKLSASDM